MVALVVFLSLQKKSQLYVPSSFSVTLKIERTSSFLHLLPVSSKDWLYFVPFLGNDHSWYSGQYGLSGFQSIKHVRFTLENILTETSVSEMVGPSGIGPVFSKKKKQFPIKLSSKRLYMLKNNNEFFVCNKPDGSHTSCPVTRHAVKWNPLRLETLMNEDNTTKDDRKK